MVFTQSYEIIVTGFARFTESCPGWWLLLIVGHSTLLSETGIPAFLMDEIFILIHYSPSTTSSAITISSSSLCQEEITLHRCRIGRRNGTLDHIEFTCYCIRYTFNTIQTALDDVVGFLSTQTWSTNYNNNNNTLIEIIEFCLELVFYYKNQ